MWVKHLTLTNFRGFESLDLDLDRPVTVLVGVNGSGKTSVLRAIAVGVGRMPHGRPEDHFEPEYDERDVHLGRAEATVKVEVHQGTSRRWSVQKFSLRSGASNEDFGDGRFLYEIANHPPFLFMLGTERNLTVAALRSSTARGSIDDDRGSVTSQAGYGRFIEWFKEREDAENAHRVAARNLDLQDPQLRAVREAVAAIMPGFDNLRIQRDLAPPAMVVTKSDVELRLDQLSDGERNLVALAGDLARRLVIANPTSEAPRETEGVILIDEIEQHLHPGLQRKVIPALQRAFPNAQLIVTTHSPQVLSSVPASAVVVLDGFGAWPVTSPTRGRDTNAILREVFGDDGRPHEEHKEVLAITALIDGDQIDEARSRLAKLAAMLSERDDDVLRLRTKLDFAEAGL